MYRLPNGARGHSTECTVQSALVRGRGHAGGDLLASRADCD